MNLFRLSWKNLTNKPLSLSLSLILFALGIGLISILFLLEKQLQENFEKNLGGIDLVVGAKGSPLQLILSSMYHIDAPTGNIKLKDSRPFLNPKHPLIRQAIPLSLGDSHREYRIVGTEHGFLELYQAAITEGKIWENNFEVTIGASVARNLHLKIGDEFESSHGFTDENELGHEEVHPFVVVGILGQTGSVIDQLILTTPQSFWIVHGHKGGDTSEEHDPLQESAELNGIPKSLLEENDDEEITSILIKFEGRNYQALNLQRNINENTDLQAATPAIEINRLFSLMNTGEQALRFLAVVITFVSGLSIFISLFSSLRERRYELALMRSMGAGRSKIFIMIILEGLIVALLGYLLGVLLSHGGMQWVASFMRESYRYSFSGFEFLREEVFLLGGALILGFVAAVLPALQASKTDIAETLTQG